LARPVISGLDEFFQRVAKREGADLPQATFHARAVIEVVGEAVTQGQLVKVRDQLPAEFDPCSAPAAPANSAADQRHRVPR
jgi:uncharacterized protein (DUF2267 family)